MGKGPALRRQALDQTERVRADREPPLIIIRVEHLESLRLSKCLTSQRIAALRNVTRTKADKWNLVDRDHARRRLPQ